MPISPTGMTWFAQVREVLRRPAGIWSVVCAGVLLGVWLAADGLLGWRAPWWLTASVVMLGAGGWIVAGARGWSAGPRLWLAEGAGLVAGLALAWGAIRAGHSTATAGHLGYVGGLAWGLVELMRWFAGRLRVRSVSWAGELLRIGVVGGAAWIVLSDCVTPRFVGGLDARWYAYAMIDAIEQARAGCWPVWIGQGEFQFNGSVHPFMTAPYLHNVMIVLDGVTLRALTPLAVIHLALVVAWMQAGVLTYFCLRALGPDRPWLAMGAALSLVLAPAGAGYVFAQEMYMTVMALSWLPLAVWANIRVVQRGDAVGWVVLAASLSLLVQSHAAVAAWVLTFTVIVQVARVTVRGFSWREGVAAAGAGLLFAALTAWYFWGMVELSPAKMGGPKPTLIGTAIAAVGAIVALRWVVTGRAGWWLVALPAPMALLYLHPLNFNWLVAYLGWCGLLVGVGRWRGAAGTVGWRLGLAWAGVPLAAIVAQALPHAMAGDAAVRANAALTVVRGLWPGALLPITATGNGLTDLQLGYVAWAGLVLAGAVGFATRDTTLRLLAAAGALLVPLVVPLPALTAHALMVIPEPLYGVSTASFWLRVLPLLAVLGVFLGFLALSKLAWPERRARRVLVVVAGAGLLVWEGWEIGKLMRRGHAAVHSAEDTAGVLRPENAQLYSYSYNNHWLPAYLINGVMDPLLESRLLRATDKVLLREPVLDAAPDRTVVMATTKDVHVRGWFNGSSEIKIAPGERLRLKFEFLPKNYEGTMILHGPGAFWREYYLPYGGFDVPSFGVPPEWPKELGLWNTSKETQTVGLRFLRANAAELPEEFGDFAHIGIKAYRADELRVNTLGLLPYRARVQAPEAVFLETPRLYLLGYRAKVDGVIAPVEESPKYLAMVRLEPGTHEVELAYVTTAKMKLAIAISVIAWLGVIGWGVRRWRLPVARPAASAGL